jgi:hypothetical protein
MTPSPHAPTIWTIPHVLEPIKKMILDLDLPGKVLPTDRNPQGTAVAARLIPLLADLQAIRKVSGFVSHSAGLFCSFCKCHHNDIEDLDYHHWELRRGTEVHAQAQEWCNLVTIKAKTAMTKETGVRWTPLHDLPYWDPVQYIILGFMHNFLEGILQYHLRVLWGIGRTKAAIKLLATLQLDDDTQADAETSSNYSEDDIASQHSSTSGLAEHLDNMDVDDENISTSTPSSTPTPSSNAVPLPSDDEDEDEEPVSIGGAFDFMPAELAMIRACISDVQLPTWVQRPPTNLGEASHGSLKAHELLILFSVIFPLVIPTLWWNGTEEQQELLQNFCELVCATNIIAGYSVSNAEADAYMDHYINYRSSMQHLFGAVFHSMPNHHYAMHNGALLKFWGPLALLSEFPGERMNGDYGRIKTNRRLRKSSIFQMYFH